MVDVFFEENTSVTPGDNDKEFPVYIRNVAHAEHEILSYKMKIRYNLPDNMLFPRERQGAPFVVHTGTLPELAGWGSPVYYEDPPGLITIVAAGATPLPDTGTIPQDPDLDLLARFMFEVNAGAVACDATDIELVSLEFNEPNFAITTMLHSGEAYVDDYHSSGAIKFWRNDEPVDRVRVILQAQQVIDTVFTDGTGNYSFNCLPYGLGDPEQPKPIRLSRPYVEEDDDATGNLSIGVTDASLILHFVIGKPIPVELGPNPFGLVDLPDGSDAAQYVADVSGDGSVSPYDAALILQMLASHPAQNYRFPAHGGEEWVFCNHNGSDFNEGQCGASSGDRGDEFVAILMGDVDGKWRQGRGKAPMHVVAMHMGDTSIDHDVATVPVTMDANTGVFGGVMEMTVDPGSRFLGARGAGLCETFMVHGNQHGTSLRIAFAGSELVQGQDKVLELQFATTTGKVELTHVTATLNDGSVEAVISQSSGAGATPTLFKVFGSYPNPFNPKTTISFYLPSERATSVRIYSAAGRLVRTLAQGELMNGLVNMEWNGSNERGVKVSSGAYFVRVEAGEWSSSHKMTLVK